MSITHKTSRIKESLDRIISLIPTPKKAQSALEYMMTYGWAILIIVIVAVILYSMGIFNPSSSVTFTSSGFSPFIIQSAFCNSIGLKVAIQAGPLPNLANSVQITKAYITSTSGGSISKTEYTLSSPITLKSGSTATTIIPVAVCNAVNTKYSFSAALTYSYSTAAGNVVTNTTGTVAGTSIAGKPSVLTNYIPVTITNTQSSATPQPFQQMVNASSSVYSSYAASNLQNVEFFYYNGTIIPSWLENYTANNATWWLKVSSIPASSSMTVYMGFAPTSTNLFNTVNNGEAPQLSSTYAEYDDGASVFNFYDNFAGNTLNLSKWTVLSGSPVVSNGLKMSINNSVTINSKATFSNPSIFDSYMKYTYAAGPDSGGVLAGFYLYNASEGGTYFIGWHAYVDHFSGGEWNPSQSWPILENTPSIGVSYVWTIVWSNKNAQAVMYTNYKGPTTPADFDNVGNVNLDIGGQAQDNAAFDVYWIRERAYPPNGVMPSITFESVA